MAARFRRWKHAFAACIVGVLVAACGGGGGTGAATPQPPAGSAGSSGAQAAPSPVPDASPPGVQTGTWWHPAADMTWQLQLTGALDTSYQAAVYDIDLFDNTASAIAGLHAAGHKVVCYFSAGSGEDWRPDYQAFMPSDLGNPLDGWAGERWLDTRSANVRSTMQARMDLAVSKGCDGVDPDNVDAYTNDPGFALTGDTQLDYDIFLASQAHMRGLAVALKNDVEQLPALAAHFDLAVNEQCHPYSECDAYVVFTGSNKPVFNVEYANKYVQNTAGARDALCAASRAANIRTLVLPVNLDDAYRLSCD
jgi:endo-alpha-1,4-polygalactosaminidase (GH114 family)